MHALFFCKFRPLSAKIQASFVTFKLTKTDIEKTPVHIHMCQNRKKEASCMDLTPYVLAKKKTQPVHNQHMDT